MNTQGLNSAPHGSMYHQLLPAPVTPPIACEPLLVPQLLESYSGSRRSRRALSSSSSKLGL